MDTPETQYDHMKRLEQLIEHDRKWGAIYYGLAMAAIFLAIGVACYLLHIQLSQNHFS